MGGEALSPACVAKQTLEGLQAASQRCTVGTAARSGHSTVGGWGLGFGARLPECKSQFSHSGLCDLGQLPWPLWASLLISKRGIELLQLVRIE